ncbi:SIR2 family protein [Vreelandella sp. EE27]
MEYLKSMFDSELRWVEGAGENEGKLGFGDIYFYPSEILKGLDTAGYENAFIEWCNQRRNERLQKADEILALYDNKDRFVRLKEIYAKGAVTPFIGAGLSRPSGYPGWTEFLERVLPETDVDKTKFDSLIDDGDFEEAAELLCNDLPRGSFLEQVENAFGVSRDIDGCVRKLPYVFTSAVITTNFDNVLERVYSESDLGAFDENLLAGDAEELPRALGEGKRTLIKLHGSANKSKNRILTKSEYDRHYQKEGSLESVIEALSTRTLLFFGCSLTVDRTLTCLKEIVARKGVENSPKHYAFLKTSDLKARNRHKRQLAECNIHVIWYTDDHDECLDALLEKLMEGVDA